MGKLLFANAVSFVFKIASSPPQLKQSEWLMLGTVAFYATYPPTWHYDKVMWNKIFGDSNVQCTRFFRFDPYIFLPLVNT
jgi:hypothetical protein